jgi:hypothetical protein
MRCLIYCYYLPWRVVQTAVLNNASYRVVQRVLGMSLLNQGGDGTEKFRNR